MILSFTFFTYNFQNELIKTHLLPKKRSAVSRERSPSSAILKVKRARKLQAKSGFDLVGLLLLCGDISLNPGPRCKYPCGVCSKAVKCEGSSV